MVQLFANWRKVFILVSIALTTSILADCEAGHLTCRQLAGKGSWCKRDRRSCHGRPDIKCSCAAARLIPTPTFTPGRAVSQQRGRPVGIPRSSFPRPVGMRRSASAFSGARRRTVGLTSTTTTTRPVVASHMRNSPKAFVPRSTTPTPETTLTTRAPHSTGPRLQSSRHEICKALSHSSWCKKDGTCHNFPQVKCGPSALPRGPQQSASERPFVLWTEWPTLEIGDWPQYFEKLLSFVNENCLGIKMTRLVMRVLNPQFQNERGLLWQVTNDSSFWKDFMRHLPSSVEVFFYPYLADVRHWTRGMNVHVPLEGAFKFTKKWNDLLEQNGVSHRIAGLVLDKEEGSLFLADLRHLQEFKSRYSSPGQPELKFGLAVGFDSVGSVSSFPPAVDDVYVEMYDFYVQGSTDPVIRVEADQNGALNNPDRFIDILDQTVWYQYLRQYGRYSNLIFMWSLQNRKTSACLYSLPDRTCGERVDMGAWTPNAFFQFIDRVKERHPVFSQRQHGLFQFNFTPIEWHACQS